MYSSLYLNRCICFLFSSLQGFPVLLIISCEKDFQLCSEFIRKGFGKKELYSSSSMYM